MTTKWHRAACVGAALAVSVWASAAVAQDAPAPPKSKPPAAVVDPVEAIPELQNQVRMLTDQVKALQTSVAQCRQEIARLNKQDDASSPPPPKTARPSDTAHTTVVDDDNPAPAVKPAGHAATKQSAYADDPGLEAATAAMEQYLKDLKPLSDTTLTDAQRSKISSDAATKLGKTINRRISITAVVQNVTVQAGSKAATITTQSNTIRQMMQQNKMPGITGSDPTFHVTLTEDQAALIRKGDEMLVTGACAVTKDMTAGGTAGVQETVVIGIQGGWHLILNDYTCKTGEISAKSVKPASAKTTGKPAKTAKKPVITNSD